jgi:hypothetical protein
MRQDQLTKESQQCDHGYFFGTTCEACEVERRLVDYAFAIRQWTLCSSRRRSWKSGEHCVHCEPMRAIIEGIEKQPGICLLPIHPHYGDCV